jgi:malate/lactate dehydrogenase
MSTAQANTSRVAIIGAGSVGATCAYALLLRRVSSEILLVDTDVSRLQAQVQDLSDADFLSNTKVHAGTTSEAGQCSIIVITAGAKQRAGESRRDLLDRNYAILASVINEMKPIRKDAVLLLVSNPVDVLTYFAQNISGLPRGQVIGSGTFLDTVRLRSMLAEQVQVRRTTLFFQEDSSFSRNSMLSCLEFLPHPNDRSQIRPSMLMSLASMVIPRSYVSTFLIPITFSIT